jgi:hypothetical protein
MPQFPTLLFEYNHHHHHTQQSGLVQLFRKVFLPVPNFGILLLVNSERHLLEIPYRFTTSGKRYLLTLMSAPPRAG